MNGFGLMVVGVGMTVALTACGTDDSEKFADGSADDIVKTAKADMAELDAVKVAGTIASDGKEVSLDLQVDSDDDCTGSLGVGSGTTELLGVGGTIWIRPDEAFWRASAGDAADKVIAAVGDKWVVLPATDDSFKQFCDVNALLDQMLKENDSDHGKYTKQGTDSVDGDDVVKVDNTDDQGSATGYVLTDDPHYLVKIVKTDGEDTGEMAFSEFNETFEVEAPADADVVDLGSLG